MKAKRNRDEPLVGSRIDGLLDRLLPAKLLRGVRRVERFSADAGELNISLISAGVAFYGLLAIFPAITAVIALWGAFADPEIVQEQVAVFAPLMPVGAYDIIAGQIKSLASGTTTTLGWASAVSIGAALWAMRSGVSALITGVNAAYRVPPRTSFFRALAAMALTLVLVAIALVALASVVLVPIVLTLVPLGTYANWTLSLLRWVLGIATVLFGVSLLYRYAPNRPGLRTPWMSPGATMAIILWGTVSVGFSIYLENFGRYDAVYGSLGAVIALLMWFYLSAYVVLLGALLNARSERRAARLADQDGLTASDNDDDAPDGDVQAQDVPPAERRSASS